VLSAEAVQAQRQRLIQQLQELKQQLQQLGTGTPSRELLQQAQRLAHAVRTTGGTRRKSRGSPPGTPRPLRNPSLIKRGDPIPR
jgi:hypothetical protein